MDTTRTLTLEERQRSDYAEARKVLPACQIVHARLMSEFNHTGYSKCSCEVALYMQRLEDGMASFEKAFNPTKT